MQMMETPISRAAHNGHLHTVKFLAEKGADVNCLDLVSNPSGKHKCPPPPMRTCIINMHCRCC